MGSNEQTRFDVMTALAAAQAAWSDYPLVIETDNDDQVDQSTQVDPYLKVEINPLRGTQADLSDRPLVEQRGQIVISVVAKEGSGEVQSNKLLDFIIPYFDMKDFTLVRTHAVEVFKPKPIAGWRYAPLLINYWFIRIST